MPVHVIPDEGESVRPNKNDEKSSEFTYHKKDADTYISLYDRVMNALKKLDKLYNPTMQRMYKPFTKGNYKATGYTRVITIVEQGDDETQWACSTPISTYSGESETPK